jgi:hypothetical protein
MFINPMLDKPMQKGTAICNPFGGGGTAKLRDNEYPTSFYVITLVHLCGKQLRRPKP